MIRVIITPFCRLSGSFIRRDIYSKTVTSDQLFQEFKSSNRFSYGFNTIRKTHFSCWSCKAEFEPFHYFCPKCAKLQKPSSSVSYFELFNITCSFEVDLDKLTKTFRTIQSKLHPDKFNQKDENEKNLSSEYSSLVNKAYSSLSNPLQRATYMLYLKNIIIEEGNIQMDQAFLIEIMELNEEIDSADSNKMLLIEKQNKVRLLQLYSDFSKAYEAGKFIEAKNLLLRIKYFVSVENRLKDLKMKSFDK